MRNRPAAWLTARRLTELEPRFQPETNEECVQKANALAKQFQCALLRKEAPANAYPTGPLSEQDLDETFGSVEDVPETIETSDEPLVPELGATEIWQREIQEGKRTKYDFDALFRASCAERNALDALREGFVAIANTYRRQAIEIMLQDYVAEKAA